MYVTRFERIKTALKNNKKNIILIALAVIIIYSLTYQLTHIEGPSYFGDDTTYTFFANAVVKGNFIENIDIFSLRLLTVYPIAFFYLFGIGKLTTAAWAITSFIGSIVIAFLIGKELYNDYVGILSALLLSFIPLLVVLSGTPSPNIPAMLFTGLAMLGIIYGQKKNSRFWYFVCGASLVASFLATPESTYFFVAIFLYILIELVRKKLTINRTTLYFVYGIAISVALLFLFNYLNAGQPLITISVTNKVYSTVGTTKYGILIDTNLNYYFNEIFSYNIINILKSTANLKNHSPPLWRQIQLLNYNYVGFYFYAVVLCAAYLILRREKRSYLPLLWITVTFLALEFGPIHISLHPFKYYLTHRLNRYLTILCIPVAITLSMAFVNMAEGLRKLSKYLVVVPALFIIFIIATAIPISLSWYKIVHYSTYDQTAIANYLNTLPNTTKIYFESGFSMTMVYMHYNNISRFYAYDNIRNCTDIPAGSYVMIPKYISPFGLDYAPDPTKYCPNWQLVLYPQINGSYSSYVTSPTQSFGAKLYYVPTS